MKTCPPCNQDCNQGRNCPARKQSGFTGIEIAIFVMAISSIATAVLPMFSSPEPRCWSGYLYDGMNGRQIIGENGGGIKCEVK